MQTGQGKPIQQLRSDIERHIAEAIFWDLVPAFRLNVASDLDWSEFVRDYAGVIGRCANCGGHIAEPAIPAAVDVTASRKYGH